jgi:protein SDA1
MSEDLLRDLVEYKTYKSKAVMMASRSLIQLFRTTCPELLHKRDRGRPTEAMLDTHRKEFGETEVVDFVPGAEVVEDEEGEEDDEEGESDEDEEEGNDEERILSLDEKKAKAREMTVGKILTDEDFKKIDAAQLKKQVVGVRMGGNKGKKRSAVEAELDSDEEADGGGRKELVNLADIEMIHKKKKHDKEVCTGRPAVLSCHISVCRPG